MVGCWLLADADHHGAAARGGPSIITLPMRPDARRIRRSQAAAHRRSSAPAASAPGPGSIAWVAPNLAAIFWRISGLLADDDVARPEEIRPSRRGDTDGTRADHKHGCAAGHFRHVDSRQADREQLGHGAFAERRHALRQAIPALRPRCAHPRRRHQGCGPAHRRVGTLAPLSQRRVSPQQITGKPATRVAPTWPPKPIRFARFRDLAPRIRDP